MVIVITIYAEANEVYTTYTAQFALVNTATWQFAGDMNVDVFENYQILDMA